MIRVSCLELMVASEPRSMDVERVYKFMGFCDESVFASLVADQSRTAMEDYARWTGDVEGRGLQSFWEYIWF